MNSLQIYVKQFKKQTRSVSGVGFLIFFKSGVTPESWIKTVLGNFYTPHTSGPNLPRNLDIRYDSAFNSLGLQDLAHVKCQALLSSLLVVWVSLFCIGFYLMDYNILIIMNLIIGLFVHRLAIE